MYPREGNELTAILELPGLPYDWVFLNKWVSHSTWMLYSWFHPDKRGRTHGKLRMDRILLSRNPVELTLDWCIQVSLIQNRIVSNSFAALLLHFYNMYGWFSRLQECRSVSAVLSFEAFPFAWQGRMAIACALMGGLGRLYCNACGTVGRCNVEMRGANSLQ